MSSSVSVAPGLVEDGQHILQALAERVQMLQKSSSSKCDFSMDNVPLGFSTQGARVTLLPAYACLWV